ncbi:aminomethyl-transferring glycine dehydrogenase subunit GcvPB [Acidianus brierleyi]|uniref:glycine dehydrogenase (aminomethyl-transferring) n=1 Tax=Acidianus brierleyi TaxID=41673 RepID=A0A2U9IG19_9CREN|nr:aminomethyl-transferring glycine dehydrogenase subunit GcvPB [Acidianus brierleyi]AWR94950.1 aminotransferase class V-fold PLP-dependent enzyme [Acidianus brierleyi]
MWKQASWDEPIIFDFKGKQRQGIIIPEDDEIKNEIQVEIPEKIRRNSELEFPQMSELEVVRHYTRLSQMSFGVDIGMMPLGSCTMKYNPKIEEKTQELVENVHPLQDISTMQGVLELLYEMQKWIAEATGMDNCSFQVPAGASGELAGVLMTKKFHENKNQNRTEMLVADTAHGTNPASAAMAGYKVIYVKTNEKGLVDLDILKEIVNENTAGFMLTNPNTLGLFEENIMEISKIIHNDNGVLYYDGANLNGILGVARPGDMGFDIVHVNLHKTFAVPHGGGGPGAGAICAKGELAEYLPYPIIENIDGKFEFVKPKKSIGKMSTFYGNVANIARAYSYILGMGAEGISMVGKMSTLATNYLITKLKGVKGMELPFSGIYRKHEVVFSVKQLMNDTGITAFDVAKALLDRGFYAPTIYFPPIVEEALMIEATETEPKETLDEFADALKNILETAYANPKDILESPHNTSVRRLDQVKANYPSTITPTYLVKKLRNQNKINLLK